MAPVPDTVLMCLAVSYSEFRSSERWQIMMGGVEGRSHTHRHGWRVLWKQRKEKIKTHTQFSLTAFVKHPACQLVSDTNTLWSTVLDHRFHQSTVTVTYSTVMLTEKQNWQQEKLTFSLWKEWRKFPLSSPSSLGVPGGLLMPLKLFGEFWKQSAQWFFFKSI